MNGSEVSKRQEFNESLRTWAVPREDGVCLRGRQLQTARAVPTLCFIHGNGFTTQTYSAMLQPLASYYDLFLQDAEGHGLSDCGQKFVGWNATAQQCRKNMQTYLDDSKEKIGVAHSFGGCLTALMSAQDPDVFTRLILLDPALFPPKLIWLMRGMKISGLLSKVPMARQAKRRRHRWPSQQHALDYFNGRGAFKGWDSTCLKDYVDSALRQNAAAEYELCCPNWMEASIFSSYPSGLWRHLKRLRVPTQIMVGRSTYAYFREAYEYLVRINPNVSLIEVDGGHCFMLERPQWVAERILQLLTTPPMVRPD